MKKKAKRPEWPKDGTPMRFETLSQSVCKAIRSAYQLERVKKGVGIPWTGPNIGENSLACSLSPWESLKAKSLAWQLEDQGRDALQIIVCLALQLGIEQGRRARNKELHSELGIAKLYAKALHKALKDF